MAAPLSSDIPLRIGRIAIADAPLVTSLLLTVLKSILDVTLLCLAGYFLARRGMLHKHLQKELNRLNIVLFTPALLFSKVAFFLTPDKLRELWIVPICFVIITATSALVAFTLARILNLRTVQIRFAIAAAIFMNSNSLPVALIQSILVSVPGLSWGPDDNKDAMLGRALSYLSLYYTLNMIVRWSYGVKLLQTDESRPQFPSAGDLDGRESPLPAPPDSDDRNQFDAETRSSSRRGEQEPLLPPRRPSTSPQLNTLGSFLSRSYAALTGIMTPPLFASLFSLLIACFSPVQEGIKEYMSPLVSALSAAGRCSIPLTLLVLGAYFYEDAPVTDNDDDDDARVGKVRRERGESQTVAIAVISRMVVTPVLLIPVVWFFIKHSSQGLFEDPVFVISVILLISSPSALTLAQIMQAAASDNTFERLISRTMFWSYCVATPPTTILVVVLGLIFIQR